MPKCQIKLLYSNSIMPYKNEISDIGYQIFLIKQKNRLSNNTVIYETGITCNPQYGYYLDLLYSDKLSKYGYIVNNNFIKSNLPIELTLIKIDNELPDIKLPFMIGYLLLKEFKHYELIN